MARYELVEGKSKKFWEIEIDGGRVTVTFGRIGTAGQSKTKTVASAAAADREHDKLVAEKTKKGYVLVASDDELAQILALDTFRTFSVVREQPGELGSYRAMPTLAPLARLKELRTIDLENANGPYSLTPLAGLVQLRELKLPGVKVDDVAPLAGLGIEELVLKDTDVADLGPLAKLLKLWRLDIWQTPATDLGQLAPCTELRELVAGNTQAKELPTLPELAKLEVANFSFSRFLNAFKKVHPHCKVEYSQATS